MTIRPKGTKRSVQICVDIQPAVQERLKDIAVANNSTFSEVVRTFLTEGLKAYEDAEQGREDQQ